MLSRNSVIRSLKRLLDLRTIRIAQYRSLASSQTAPALRSKNSILIFTDEILKSSSESFEMIKKLSEAIEKHNLKVEIMNSGAGSLDSILRENTFKVVICFSSESKVNSEFDQIHFIYSQSVSDLIREPALKKKLWTEIQKVLGLS